MTRKVVTLGRQVPSVVGCSTESIGRRLLHYNKQAMMSQMSLVICCLFALLLSHYVVLGFVTPKKFPSCHAIGSILRRLLLLPMSLDTRPWHHPYTFIAEYIVDSFDTTTDRETDGILLGDP
eukprot:scaffold3428_cov76-Cylindrotheca_fusiformis.AAC.1